MSVIHGRNGRNLLPASESAARRIIHARKVPDNCSVITRGTEMKRTGGGKETVQNSCSGIQRSKTGGEVSPFEVKFREVKRSNEGLHSSKADK